MTIRLRKLSSCRAPCKRILKRNKISYADTKQCIESGSGLPFERDPNPVKEGPKKKINTVIKSQIYSLYDWEYFSGILKSLMRRPENNYIEFLVSCKFCKGRSASKSGFTEEPVSVFRNTVYQEQI